MNDIQIRNRRLDDLSKEQINRRQFTNVKYSVLLHNAVDFEAAASQNGFSTLVGRLFLYKKTNIIQKMTKNIRFFYYFRLYH